MKRKVIIATVAAAALVGGGAATAFGAVGNDSGAQPQSKSQPHSNVRTVDHDDDHDRDDRGEDRRDDRDDDGREHDTAAGKRAERAAETGSADVSLSEAIKAVHKAVPGDITELDLDTDRNRLVWEADVLGKDNKWHDVEIDATTGKLTKNRVDAHKDDDRSVPRTVKLDAAAAGKKAAAETKGSVTSLDLERNGQWEADTVDKKGDEHELNLDAASGKITHHETEKADSAD